MDHPQGILRTGDRATVQFEFISHPEFIKEGMKLLFREGKTKVWYCIINDSGAWTHNCLRDSVLLQNFCNSSVIVLYTSVWPVILEVERNLFLAQTYIPPKNAHRIWISLFTISFLSSHTYSYTTMSFSNETPILKDESSGWTDFVRSYDPKLILQTCTQPTFRLPSTLRHILQVIGPA